MLASRRAIINTLTKSPPFSTTAIPHAPPSSAYYDELIDFSGRNRDFATVNQLLNKRVKSGCFNTTATFKFISTDLSILDDLLTSFANLDNGLASKGAYNSLIAQLSKLHETGKALMVAEQMVKNSVGAKAASFHPILNAVTRKRKMEEAWRVLGLIQEFKLKPDTTSYNYLLTSYCLTGDLVSASGVLEKMRDLGLREDERSYDALVLGACRSGKLEAALEVLSRMVEEGVAPLYSSYAHVINGMCRDGYYAQGLELVRSFGGRDLKLDSENFGLLGARLISLKRFDEAKVVVEEMKKRNIAMGVKLRDFYQLHVVSS